MNDLIKREDVINAIDKRLIGLMIGDILKQDINDLPPAVKIECDPAEEIMALYCMMGSIFEALDEIQGKVSKIMNPMNMVINAITSRKRRCNERSDK